MLTCARHNVGWRRNTVAKGNGGLVTMRHVVLRCAASASPPMVTGETEACTTPAGSPYRMTARLRLSGAGDVLSLAGCGLHGDTSCPPSAISPFASRSASGPTSTPSPGGAERSAKFCANSSPTMSPETVALVDVRRLHAHEWRRDALADRAGRRAARGTSASRGAAGGLQRRAECRRVGGGRSGARVRSRAAGGAGVVRAERTQGAAMTAVPKEPR